ncbi:hypothetical protein [Streptomyces mirabilis]
MLVAPILRPRLDDKHHVADRVPRSATRTPVFTVAKQLVVDDWEVYEDDLKPDTGARTIALDSDTVQALMRHRAQQDKDREEWGSAWAESVRVFTEENGEMLPLPTSPGRSSSCTRRFGLRPVQLHGAATSAHTAGADLKNIQEMLGHSSITITADTYTSLLPEADLAVAEAAARLVPRARAASVPDDADPSGDIREINSPSAHGSLTQTAPDETSEAE